ncbi:LamG-like jellyroll fold domain-containing protein [Streptomyces sp. NPDC012888]|uniref:LamG-like jellyroll fold domain-containing protein n=1 Tax=Streptomyces sp. NPDC012888 TaxID=3364855 RepID=UPI0036934C28
MRRSRNAPSAFRGTVAAALLSSAAAVAATLVAISPAQASGTQQSTPDPEDKRNEQVLFRSGTGGYGCYRIPTLTRTKTGALLAFAEARTSPSCADRGPMDIVVRRSTNDGRTWGPVRTVLTGRPVIREEGKPDQPGDPKAPWTHGNASPVADLETGDVFLLSTGEPTVPGGKRLAYVQKSTDDGVSFGLPADLHRLSGRTDGWFGTGPSHGIQLRNGTAHDGRLVVGAYESPSGKPQHTGVYYSDDHGATWKTSATYAAGETVPPAAEIKPTEPSVVELLDGTVYVGARNEVSPKTGPDGKPVPPHHRVRARSTDGGATVRNFQTVPSLVTPQIQASLLAPRLTYQNTPGDTLIAAAPADPMDRGKFEIRYSLDHGETWQRPADDAGRINKDRVGYPDRAGYSDLVEMGVEVPGPSGEPVMTGGEIGMVYEGGSTFSAQHVYFKRFYPSDLKIPGTFAGTRNPQPRQLPGPTTPDSGPHANDAYLADDAKVVKEGRFGQGLALDGALPSTAENPNAADWADVPYAASIDPGQDGFTYSLHFRRDPAAPTTAQVLMWAYGVNAEPQVWVRAYPAEGVVRARVEGPGGKAVTTVVSVPEAFAADAGWYHLTLVRSGKDVTLAVASAADPDRTAVVRDQRLGTALEGPVTSPRHAGNDGIRIGAKPDGTNPFKGTVDDFRMYRTALTESDLELLGTGRTTAKDKDHIAARLAFQVVDDATPAGPVTEFAIADDVSGNCADATILLDPGKKPVNTASGDARMGKYGLTTDSTRQGLEVPYTPALDPGTGDFTHTLWFRYTATTTTPGSTLVWAYGVGTEQAPKPSLWVRTDPKNDRLHALAETDHGKVWLELKDKDTTRTAFGDGGWHLLTLTREGDSLTLQVDAPHADRTAGGTGLGADGTGSFTAGRPDALGLRLGSRPGGTEVFTGALDDYRFYHRALTRRPLGQTGPDQELDKITKTGSGTADYPVDQKVWWSLEHSTTQVHDMYTRPVVGGPATPDASGHCNNAFVRGDAVIDGTGGTFGGGGVTLDGTDGHVELPFTDTEAIGSEDFTLAVWVRFDAAKAGLAKKTPVIAWAYGQGDADRQLWIRAEPEHNRISALIQTDLATSYVKASDASFRTDKDAYHHVVLQRADGKLTLTITETGSGGSPVVAKGEADAPAGGSVHSTDDFQADGIKLGSRLDGGHPFEGSLDEFTLVRRALTPDELTALRVGNELPADRATVARLSFEKITSTGYARM